MRAYRLVEPRVAALVDVETPEPGPGEVLLRVAGAGVCHSDLHIVHTPEWHTVPMTLGHEVSGHVERTGPGVTGWEHGAGVLAYLCWGCGLCRACVSGRENACEAAGRGTVPGPGLGREGTMAEYVVIPARFLVPLGGLDPVDAAPLTDAGLTPYHAVNRVREALTSTATAVVVGIGGLGHMAVQILAATTAARIIAIDLDEARLDLAAGLGAHETLQSGSSTASAILDLTRGRGVEVVLDFVGVEQALRLAAEVVAPDGWIVLAGLAGGSLPLRAAAPPEGLPWGVGVVKPYGGTRADLHDVIALAEQGVISVTVERHPLDEAERVFARLEAGEVTGRAVLIP